MPLFVQQIKFQTSEFRTILLLWRSHLLAHQSCRPARAVVVQPVMASDFMFGFRLMYVYIYELLQLYATWHVYVTSLPLCFLSCFSCGMLPPKKVTEALWPYRPDELECDDDELDHRENDNNDNIMNKVCPLPSGLEP